MMNFNFKKVLWFKKFERNLFLYFKSKSINHQTELIVFSNEQMKTSLRAVNTKIVWFIPEKDAVYRMQKKRKFLFIRLTR